VHHLGEVEGPDRRFPEGCELPERRENARAVRLQVAVLLDDSELEGEPEDPREHPQRFVGLDPANCSADELVQARGRGIGELIRVAEHLVHDVGLGRVERRRMVTDVLGRQEHVLVERAVELAQRRETGDGLVPKPGEGRESLRDITELRDVIARELERFDRVEECTGGMLAMFGRELATHGSPDLVLHVGVFDDRDRRVDDMPDRERCDRVAAGAVLRIGEAGMRL